MRTFFNNGKNIRFLGIILILCSTAGFSFILRYYNFKAQVAQSLNRNATDRLNSLLTNYKNFHTDRVRYMDYRIVSPTLIDTNDKKSIESVSHRMDYFEYEYKNSLVALGCLMESYVPNSMTCKELNRYVMELKEYPKMRKMDYQLTEAFKTQLSQLGQQSKIHFIAGHRYKQLGMNSYDIFLLIQIIGLGLFPIAEIIDRSSKT